jgi:hypothetical protein
MGAIKAPETSLTGIRLWEHASGVVTVCIEAQLSAIVTRVCDPGVRLVCSIQCFLAQSGFFHSLCCTRPPQAWGSSSNTNKGFQLELPSPLTLEGFCQNCWSSTNSDCSPGLLIAQMRCSCPYIEALSPHHMLPSNVDYMQAVCRQRRPSGQGWPLDGAAGLWRASLWPVATCTRLT